MTKGMFNFLAYRSLFWFKPVSQFRHTTLQIFTNVKIGNGFSISRIVLELLARYVFYVIECIRRSVSKNSLTDSLPLTLIYFTNFSDCHVVALCTRVIFSLKHAILTLIRLSLQLCPLAIT